VLAEAVSREMGQASQFSHQAASFDTRAAFADPSYTSRLGRGESI
jgi:hypothetical protein